MLDSRNYTYFVWLHPTNTSYSVSHYTDLEGNHKYISRGEDERGNTLFRRWKFTPSRRTISIPNSQAEVIEHLKNHPRCAKSKNGFYKTGDDGKRIQVGIVFKVMDDGSDAEIAIEAMEIKTEATSKALEYKKRAINDAEPEAIEEMNELALLLGSHTKDPRLQLHHILQYAENNPQKFLDVYNDPNRRARYLIKKGLSSENKYIKKKGFMIYYGDVHLGNDLDQAVQTLMKDKDLMKAIEENIKAL